MTTLPIPDDATCERFAADGWMVETDDGWRWTRLGAKAYKAAEKGLRHLAEEGKLSVTETPDGPRFGAP